MIICEIIDIRIALKQIKFTKLQWHGVIFVKHDTQHIFQYLPNPSYLFHKDTNREIYSKTQIEIN